MRNESDQSVKSDESSHSLISLKFIRQRESNDWNESIQFFSLGKNEKITGARLFRSPWWGQNIKCLNRVNRGSLRLISLQLVIFKIHKDHVAATLKILSYKFVWRLWRILLQLSTALQFFTSLFQFYCQDFHTPHYRNSYCSDSHLHIPLVVLVLLPTREIFSRFSFIS